jgi:leucyl/phenylalanyl-tRNA---protein transferase
MAPWRMNTVDALVGAYRAGYFPMGDNRASDAVRWYNPDPRAILPLTTEEGLHIPRRLSDRIRSRPYILTTDRAFETVMRRCAAPRPPPGEQESWIDERIIAAYTALHSAGHAHSVEAWTRTDKPELVGGLYGVHIGAAFFAESKFYSPDRGTDASKICLVTLVEHLRERGFELLDVQFWNPHIAQFGCVDIPRGEYLERLRRATARDTSWLPFQAG